MVRRCEDKSLFLLWERKSPYSMPRVCSMMSYGKQGLLLGCAGFQWSSYFSERGQLKFHIGVVHAVWPPVLHQTSLFLLQLVFLPRAFARDIIVLVHKTEIWRGTLECFWESEMFCNPLEKHNFAAVEVAKTSLKSHAASVCPQGTVWYCKFLPNLLWDPSAVSAVFCISWCPSFVNENVLQFPVELSVEEVTLSQKAPWDFQNCEVVGSWTFASSLFSSARVITVVLPLQLPSLLDWDFFAKAS